MQLLKDEIKMQYIHIRLCYWFQLHGAREIEDLNPSMITVDDVFRWPATIINVSVAVNLDWYSYCFICRLQFKPFFLILRLSNPIFEIRRVVLVIDNLQTA